MPLIGRVIQFVTGVAALGYFSAVLLAMLLLGQAPLKMLFTTMFFSAGMFALIVWMFVGLQRRTFRSRMPIALFLWVMLFAAPVTNYMRAKGLYLPNAELPDEQLLGAALGELARYIIYIALIVWSGYSKKLKAYLSISEQDSGL